MRLLGLVVNHAIDFLLRITPPHLSRLAAEAFDAMIEAARLQILQRHDHSDPGNPPIITARAHRVAQLPINFGGFGQTSAVSKSAA